MRKDERWRGRMPFRQNRRLWTEPLDQQGRGGEPSLANFVRWWERQQEIVRQGQGKAQGSFTQRVRQELAAWLKRQGLTWHGPISFEYRLHRHRRITVTVSCPRIFHRPYRGDGSKGFVLEGVILSINGLPPSHRNQFGEFAITRIIGRHPLRLLSERTEAK